MYDNPQRKRKVGATNLPDVAETGSSDDDMDLAPRLAQPRRKFSYTQPEPDGYSSAEEIYSSGDEGSQSGREDYSPSGEVDYAYGKISPDDIALALNVARQVMAKWESTIHTLLPVQESTLTQDRLVFLLGPGTVSTTTSPVRKPGDIRSPFDPVGDDDVTMAKASGSTESQDEYGTAPGYQTTVSAPTSPEIPAEEQQGTQTRTGEKSPSGTDYDIDPGYVREIAEQMFGDVWEELLVSIWGNPDTAEIRRDGEIQELYSGYLEEVREYISGVLSEDREAGNWEPHT